MHQVYMGALQCVECSGNNFVGKCPAEQSEPVVPKVSNVSSARENAFVTFLESRRMHITRCGYIAIVAWSVCRFVCVCIGVPVCAINWRALQNC